MTLKSGRVLALNLAPFAVGNRLKKVVARELLNVNVDLGKLKLGQDLGMDSLADPAVLNTLKSALCVALASDKIEEAMFECAIRCTLDGMKITPDSFESPDARQDFLPVAWEVMVFNLTPFLGGLNLPSSAILLPAKSDQK
jgi:hypothetical protein